MTKSPSKIGILIAGLVSLVILVIPILWILLDPKSPLHSSNVDFINGFVLGMGFVFFILVGAVYGSVALSGLRALANKSHKTKN